MSEFTDNLNYFLKKNQITPKELAKEVGVTQGSVSHWLNGRNKPETRSLRKIAEVLGVKVSDLTGHIEHVYTDMELLDMRKTLLDMSDKCTDEDLDKLIKIVDHIMSQNKDNK